MFLKVLLKKGDALGVSAQRRALLRCWISVLKTHRETYSEDPFSALRSPSSSTWLGEYQDPSRKWYFDCTQQKKSVSLTKKISKAALLSAAYCEEIYPSTPPRLTHSSHLHSSRYVFLIKSQDLNVSSHRVWDILVSDLKTLLTIFITCGIKEGVDSDDDPLSWSTFATLI